MGKYTEYRVGYRVKHAEYRVGYRGKHTEYRVGYRENTQNTGWVIGKTHRIQSGL